MFFSPSPMTHSPMPIARLLLQPSTFCAAAVLDFIPHDLPGQYLDDPTAHLAYSTALAWLALYDRWRERFLASRLAGLVARHCDPPSAPRNHQPILYPVRAWQESSIWRCKRRAVVSELQTNASEWVSAQSSHVLKRSGTPGWQVSGRSMGIRSCTHVTIGIPAAWHWENRLPSFGYNSQLPSSIKSMSSCEIVCFNRHQSAG